MTKVNIVMYRTNIKHHAMNRMLYYVGPILSIQTAGTLKTAV